jgi:hypothetical protein
MYACIPEIGCGFFEGECRKRIGHLLFATRPPAAPRFILEPSSHRQVPQSPTETCCMTFQEKKPFF